MTTKQDNIDTMGQTLFESFAKLIDKDEVKNAQSLYQEWVVDGLDPEDGEYEFLLLNKLSF